MADATRVERGPASGSAATIAVCTPTAAPALRITPSVWPRSAGWRRRPPRAELRSSASASRQRACCPGVRWRRSQRAAMGACTVGPRSAGSRSIVGQSSRYSRPPPRERRARTRSRRPSRSVPPTSTWRSKPQSQLVVRAGAGRRELVLRPRVVRVVRVRVGGHAGTGRADAAAVFVTSDKGAPGTVRRARLDVLTVADAPRSGFWSRRLCVVHGWRGGFVDCAQEWRRPAT